MSGSSSASAMMFIPRTGTHPSHAAKMGQSRGLSLIGSKPQVTYTYGNRVCIEIKVLGKIPPITNRDTVDTDYILCGTECPIVIINDIPPITN